MPLDSVKFSHQGKTLTVYRLNARPTWYVKNASTGHRARSLKTTSKALAIETARVLWDRYVEDFGSRILDARARDYFESSRFLDLAPATRQNYLRVYRRHVAPLWGNKPLERIDPRAVARVVNGVDPTGSGDRAAYYVGKHVLAVLRNVYALSNRLGYVSGNPMADVMPPEKPKQRRHSITDEEFAALILAAPEYFGAYLWLLRITGQRRMTVARVTMEDFTDDGLLVRSSKGGGVRLYEWSPKLRDVVETWKRCRPVVQFRRSAPFLCHQDGRPVTTNTIQRWFDATRRRAGLANVMLKDFRNRGADDAFLRVSASTQQERIAAVQALLGQKSARTAAGYVTVDEVPQRVKPLQ